MPSKSRVKARTAFFAAVATFFTFCCTLLAGQVTPPCSQVLYCLFNQEAAASGPGGIHKYSRDLVGLVLPDQWTFGQHLGSDYAASLADRLARAEQTARTGDGKLVPEAAVVKAFNGLMQEIGAPPSMRANDEAVHRFREHAASIRAFPALFSADRNGTNCNPGEAVFLLYLLIWNDGVLHEGNLDFSVYLMEPSARRGHPRAYPMRGGRARNSSNGTLPAAAGLLAQYPSDHGRKAAIALFNHLAGTLGF